MLDVTEIIFYLAARTYLQALYKNILQNESSNPTW